MQTRHPSCLVFQNINHKLSEINKVGSFGPMASFIFWQKLVSGAMLSLYFSFFITSNLLLEEIHLLQSSQNTMLMATILK